RVHNVPLEQYGHSTTFLGKGHARKLWLPFLWGISPEEFSQYCNDSIRALRYHEQGKLNELDDLISVFWARAYSWTQGKPLEDYVRELIARSLRGHPHRASIDEIVRRAQELLYLATNEAMNEVAKNEGVNETTARAYEPGFAICLVVKMALKE